MVARKEIRTSSSIHLMKPKNVEVVVRMNLVVDRANSFHLNNQAIVFLKDDRNSWTFESIASEVIIDRIIDTRGREGFRAREVNFHGNRRRRIHKLVNLGRRGGKGGGGG